MYTKMHLDIILKWPGRALVRLANSSTIVGYPLREKERPEGQPALSDERVPAEGGWSEFAG